ncbi:SET domain-containing protein [Guyanagaster necrorhizus]|uniref:SET domain-containing protein n=1 Tax=Guyanagaster necrorhizus TaxID=856835 RepID=A0A9P8AS56_9AGAR|nr:SET domain-containing protein [Guyanagaster necrorhizus MCA 3950]KAG7445775.1 SET domain-containing protein [Guyanagaster necrorhizus MCA 3950]
MAREKSTQQSPGIKRNTTTSSRGTPSHRPQAWLLWSLIFLVIAVFLALVYNVYFNQRNSPPFEVVDLPGRGKGVIASRDIQRGELVIQEKPLFIVPYSTSDSPTALISHRVQSLNDLDYHAFFNLSYVNFPKSMDPEVFRDEVAMAIFQTNAVAVGQGVGIFPRMARLNHGCSSAFNVVYSWRQEKGEIVVHALQNISRGQELLTTYTDTKRPRKERREYLSKHYGFHCMCSVCSLPPFQSQASDERLNSISELYSLFSTWGTHSIRGTEAIDVVRRIWTSTNEEGYYSERGQLFADAALVSLSHSDVSAARAWATVAAEWYGYELGQDSEQVANMGAIIARPEAHYAWGTREHLIVGGP